MMNHSIFGEPLFFLPVPSSAANCPVIWFMTIHLQNYRLKTARIYRYLRGLMGTFNERAEKLMDKLTDIADKKTEASMLHLVNCVTMDVIGKVLGQSAVK